MDRTVSKCTLLIATSLLVHILQAQTPTITAAYGEAGTSSGLCPGGIAFVQGTNLGNNPNSVSVTVGAKNAFVINATNTSLQIELPFEAPLGATTLKVGASAAFNITLVQYSPGLPVNPQAGSIVTAFHQSNLAPVTTSFPATPNEQIVVLATGLGPTKPPAATGFAPTDFSYPVVTLPTISIAGKQAAVQAAFLTPNNSPGFYVVLFNMQSDVTTGNQSMTVSIGGLTSNSGNLPVSTGPVVASVSNAASYINSSLPNGAIAQGGIFVVQGINLGPANISIAPAAFQSTTLSGTSASVTVGATTVAPLMYYTSAGQLAALMPSNTPTGAGTITLTYNGQAGPAAPIRVGPSAPGIFTVSSDGQGAGIVTYADYSLVSTAKASNCGGVNTTCGAANPGDALIIWATGLGAISGGTDQSGTGLGVNMTSLPLTVWLGGVQATAIYQGRSGCCIGEDQVVITVPANVPTGCNVPLTLQVNNFVSNGVAVAIAPAGSRTCPSTNPAFTTDAVNAFATTAGPFTFGQVELKRSDNPGGFVDKAGAEFLRFSVPSALQPFIMSYIDVPPPGSCQIYNNPNGSPDPPLNFLTALDAGPQITVQGPNGSKNFPASNGSYGGTLSNSGNYFAPGTITVSAPGGADVKAFSVPVTVPAMPMQTSPTPDSPNPFTVTRSNGLTVNWSGGAANSYIKIEGFNQTDNIGTVGGSFTCIVPASPGTFTIPPYVLMALPASGPFSFGGLDFRPTILPGTIPGSNLNVSQVTLQYDYFTTMAFR
jgi:uncharacterized protein (TIGR03437 family)